MEKVKCSCKWKSCKRYDRCDECRNHHSKHPKHPLPFCKKQGETSVPDDEKGEGKEKLNMLE